MSLYYPCPKKFQKFVSLGIGNASANITKCFFFFLLLCQVPIVDAMSESPTRITSEHGSESRPNHVGIPSGHENDRMTGVTCVHIMSGDTFS